MILVLGAATTALLVGWLVLRAFAPWARDEFHPIAWTPSPESARHPVSFSSGPAAPKVPAVLPGAPGPSGLVSCSTCHATRAPNVRLRSSTGLVEFHQGLDYRHGDLSCLSCHHAENYDTLRRADGSAVAFPEATLLCAQCHGTQYRDYLNGAHGGMTGHWDLGAGSRQRNICLDCHDAHAPAYPRVQPAFPPQDRGARQQKARMAEREDSGDHG